MTIEAICKDSRGHVEKVSVDESFVDVFDYDDVEDWCRYEISSPSFDICQFDIINYSGMIEQASKIILEN